MFGTYSYGVETFGNQVVETTTTTTTTTLPPGASAFYVIEVCGISDAVPFDDVQKFSEMLCNKYGIAFQYQTTTTTASP